VWLRFVREEDWEGAVWEDESTGQRTKGGEQEQDAMEEEWINN